MDGIQTMERDLQASLKKDNKRQTNWVLIRVIIVVLFFIYGLMPLPKHDADTQMVLGAIDGLFSKITIPLSIGIFVMWPFLVFWMLSRQSKKKNVFLDWNKRGAAYNPFNLRNPVVIVYFLGQLAITHGGAVLLSSIYQGMEAVQQGGGEIVIGAGMILGSFLAWRRVIKET